MCVIIIGLYFGFSVISISEREGDPESILYVCIFPTSIKMQYITEVPFVWGSGEVFYFINYCYKSTKIALNRPLVMNLRCNVPLMLCFLGSPQIGAILQNEKNRHTHV